MAINSEIIIATRPSISVNVHSSPNRFGDFLNLKIQMCYNCCITERYKLWKLMEHGNLSVNYKDKMSKN